MYMNRIIGIVILIILIAGGWYIFSNRPAEDMNEDLPSLEEQEVSPLVAYFAQEMTKPVSPEGPIPVEGYDAGLLLGRYEGLTNEDFDGVESFQGVYRIENGELVFTLEEQMEHSAAQTISAAGYETLLNNLIDRLALTIDSEESIDALIITLQ